MLTRRKGQSPLDTYLDALDRDPEEIQERQEFFTELTQFYRRRWNCALKVPQLCGLDVDLFRLYRAVGTLGGWLKVSNSSRWPDVLDALKIPEDIAEAEYAIKLVYMRYLSRFEQHQSTGDTQDDDDDAAGGRSARGKGFMASLVSDCPLSRRQELPDFMRHSMGLSFHRALHTPYDRIVRSLQSGLPNEVDFALNICTMLSHPGPRFMQLHKSPKVVELLLAHAGVFEDGPGSSRQLYEHAWRPASGRRFVDFWLDSVNDVEIRELLGVSDTALPSKVTERDAQIFAGLKSTYDTTEPVSWRIYQIASIVRNLSFEACNKATLANSEALLRFLFVCIHSKWTPLQSMALDTLSNVATEMSLTSLEAQSKQLLFRTLSRCLHADDKLHVIRSLETLASLCSKPENEAMLCDYLEPMVLRKILGLIAVRDIMMCVYVLECIYQVSELGNETCDRLAAEEHAVDTLVNLTTTEAVSFGPSGLMGMKVVEYHSVPQPHTAILPHPSRQGVHPVSLTAQRPPAPSPQPQIRPPPPPAMFMPPQSPVQRVPNTTQVPGPSTSGAAVRPALATPVVGQQPNPHFRGPAVTVHQDQQVEVLSTQWIKNNCVPDQAASVSRGELYAIYVNEMLKVHNSLAVSVHTFSNLLKSVFPSCCIRKANESSSLMHIDGILYEPKSTRQTASAGPQSPHFACPSPSASPASLASQHPLMQQMLSRSTPTASPKHSPSSASRQHPRLASRLVGRSVSLGSGPDSVGTPDDASGTATPDSLVSDTSIPSPQVAASKGGSKSPKLVKLPQNCKVKLEVCEEALSASAIIEDSDSHEAKIVRVENTTLTQPASPVLPEPQKPNQEVRVNGRVDSATPPLSENGEKSEEPVKRLVNGLILDRKRSNPKLAAEPVTEKAPTPSPESMKENVNNCQANIEQLLTENGEESSHPETNCNQTVPPSTEEQLLRLDEPNGEPNGESNGEAADRKSTLRRKPSVSKAPLTRSAKAKSPAPGQKRPHSTEVQEEQPVCKKSVTPVAQSTEIFMCEWNGCGRMFSKAPAVFFHAATEHINESTNICKWPRCDQTIRSKWSLATHVQDRHCSEGVLKAAAQRRQEISVAGCSKIPEPKEPPPHPGYSKNAAIEAIRRHAYNYIQRDLTDETEGPVTKSIRLTSCLILRNLARYSTEGRRRLKRHERHLAWLSLSRLESSSALAQCLGELSSPPVSPGSVEKAVTL